MIGHGPRGWNPKSPEEIEREQAAAAVSDEWAAMHAAVFGSGRGRELLEKYHTLLVETNAGREATEAELRYRDAQRALIISIERATASGLSRKPK